jgi:hypothetical protein
MRGGQQRESGSGVLQWWQEQNSDGGGVGGRSSSKHSIGARGFGKIDQRWWLVEYAEMKLLLTGNRNKLDWIEIDRKGERKCSPARRTGIRGSAFPGRDDSVLVY